jgi:hypothetical protein
MQSKTDLIKVESLCEGSSTVYIHTQDLWLRGVCSAIRGLSLEGIKEFIVQRKGKLFSLNDHLNTLSPIQEIDIKTLVKNDNVGFISETRPYQVEAYADLAKEVTSTLEHAPDIHIFHLINQAIYIGIARGYGELLSEGYIERLPLVIGAYAQDEPIDITSEISRIRDSTGGILEFVTEEEIRTANSYPEIEAAGDFTGIAWLLQERDRSRKKKKVNYLIGDIIISNHIWTPIEKISPLIKKEGKTY